MLKHHLYELERPVFLFAPEQPPCVPNVLVHQSVQQLVPMLSSLVANKISLKSRDNPIRTYHYNECSFNNWANQDFAEAVKFAADNLATLLSVYVNTAFEDVLDKAINDALIMLTSRKVFEVPEIESAITPMLRNAAAKNVRLYQQKQIEIDKLYDSIDSRSRPKSPPVEKPPVNPNEIYQQPYPEEDDMTGMPNAYNVNPRNAPGYNNPPPNMQPNANGFMPGYDPQIRAGQYPQQRYPNQNAQQPNMQQYPQQQYQQQFMQPGMQSGMQQQFPQQQFMQPGMQQYPQQFMQPGMHPAMMQNPQFMQSGMQPGMHQQFPQQQFMQSGMHPGMMQPGMYPNNAPNVFQGAGPGFTPQGPGMLNNGTQAPYGGYNNTNFQVPGYPRGFIPYNHTNFNSPQNGQARTFQQANFNHTSAAQTMGLTENLSGMRFNNPVNTAPVNPGPAVQTNNPLDQNAYFDPRNQPNRQRPGTAHASPEFAMDNRKPAPRFNFDPQPINAPRNTPEPQPTQVQNKEAFNIDKYDDDDPWSYDNIIEKVTVNEWRTNDGQPYLQMINPLIEREEFHKINDKVRQVIIPLENPVKRDQHTIKMLGDTYRLDGVISNKRMERLEASAQNLLKISGTDVGNSEEKPDEKVMAERFPEVEVKHYVDPGRIIDYFPDQALFEASLRYVDYNLTHKESHTNTYRCFMAVNKPILTNADYHDFIHELRQARNFETLSKRIMSQSKACYEIDNEAKKGLNYLSFIGVLVNINQMLTSMVNSCLRHELTLPEISIDSFIEDVNDLPEFLEKNYSAKYREAFEEWERNIMQRLFVYHDKPETLKANLLTEKQIEAGMEVTFIPETYSATFISSTFAELNLNFGKKETLLLSKKSQKALYAVAQSLFYQKDGGARDSVVDYVVTSDGIKLRIYRGYLGNEAYLVSKA